MELGSGDLTLGHILAASGLTELHETVAIRHTFTVGGLRDPSDVTPASVLAYTREQGAQRGHKLGPTPPRTWLVFMTDGAHRSRFYCAYENRGEIPHERTASRRFFDLLPSDLMRRLSNRLVIDWSKDTINWAKSGKLAASFPVVEIADPDVVEFPGFDRVLISYPELRAVVDDSRYARWRTVLGSVQAIYLIADTTTGHLYVGKADGRERLLGRWSSYARDGHGGNLALKELAAGDGSHAQNFVFSVLRVFDPSAPANEVDEAEAHFKRALLTRQFGLNRN